MQRKVLSEQLAYTYELQNTVTKAKAKIKHPNNLFIFVSLLFPFCVPAGLFDLQAGAFPCVSDRILLSKIFCNFDNVLLIRLSIIGPRRHHIEQDIDAFLHEGCILLPGLLPLLGKRFLPVAAAFLLHRLAKIIK
jgi:hypothetical protein